MMVAALSLVLAATPGDPTVIRVGDATVSAAAISERASDLRKGAQRFTPEQLVEGFVTETLLLVEARRTKLEQDPTVSARLEHVRQKTLAEQFVARELSRTVAVPEEEIRRLYHFGNDSIRLGLVVVATREEAAAVRSRLEQGGELALEAARSLDPSSAGKRGDTGLRTRMQLDPSLADAAFAAKIGALIGPVELRNGWGVARVVELNAAAEQDLPKARGQIEASARRRSLASARTHFVQVLREKRKVVMDPRRIEQISGAKPPAPDDVIATMGGQKLRYRQVIPAIESVATIGHGGGAMRARAVEEFVDEWLLAVEAVDRKLDQLPEVRAAVDRAVASTLSRSLAERLAAESGDDATPDQRAKDFGRKVKALRKRFDVWVDRPTALQAASGSN